MVRIKKNKLAIIIACTVIATLLVTVGGFFVYGAAADITFVSKSKYEEMKDISNRYGKLYQIQNTIEENSLWDIDVDTQMEAIYDGLVGSLNDKYSAYMNEAEVKEWNEFLNGSFSGVGVNFTLNEDHQYEVLGLIEDSPAASSGLKAGDILLTVDGKTYDELDEMSAALRGEEGTSVEIEYSRDGKKNTVTLTRAQIKEVTVNSTILDDNIGYIRIKSFEKGTADEFNTELKDLENKGVSGIVIDIRNNGGGYTDEGINIADMLLPEGTITYMEDNKGKKNYHNSDENCTKVKYVLLVNENTASTSEILAAAIKDNKGGALVGTTTFGKGIVQGTYDLRDGTALKLTIMQYFSPNGDKIHEIGVKPDYVVEIPEDATTDTQLEKALELLK